MGGHAEGRLHRPEKVDGHRAHAERVLPALDRLRDDAHQDEEPDDVAEAPLEKRDGFEEHRERRHQRHGRHAEDQEGRQQRPQLNAGLLPRDELRDDGHHGEHPHHGQQHRKVGERLAQGVERLRHGSGREDLAHARPPVALDGVLHHVETGQTDEEVDHQDHQHADPGRVVDPPDVAADPELELARAHGPAEPGGEPQGEEKAVAPHPLQEVGAHQVVEDAGLARYPHAASLTRLSSRTAR